jgi:hypothetical protein
MKLRLVPQLSVKEIYREFHESLTNDLVNDTGSVAETWTVLSDMFTNCTEQKKILVFHV